MAKRRRNDEIAFGSDSFLDIVANIVGILIILIVIAGVRVSQMPALLTTSAETDAQPAADSAPMLSIEPVPFEIPEPLPVPQTPVPPPEPMAPPKPITPSPKLLAQIESLSSEIERLNFDHHSLSALLAEKAHDAESHRQRLAATQNTVSRVQASTEHGRRAVATLQTQLDTGLREIAGLHLELAETAAAQPPSKVLRHKLTPVGKLVEGPETHLLLSKGRVAVVPVEELAEELQKELLRKKSQLIRGQTRIGSVGPVKGFIMEYAVEREAISLMDELRMGTAVIKLGISEWRMLPQPTAVFESADEALLPHSRFLNALRAAGANATLTFWVYPDSFALYRELQDFAHDNSFDVAARPLPDGIPITGSKHGTRSVSQ